MKIVLVLIVSQLALATAEQSKIWSILSKMANKEELVELMKLQKTMTEVHLKTNYLIFGALLINYKAR